MPRSLYIGWTISLLAMGGSLFFSNVLMLPPCSLCWWQRIFMFPLAAVFGVGFVRKDAGAFAYAAPLVLAGLATAAYHNLLYYGVIAKEIVPCTAGGPSCSSKQLELLGFITIPMLSLGVFTALAALILHHYISKGKDHA